MSTDLLREYLGTVSQMNNIFLRLLNLVEQPATTYNITLPWTLRNFDVSLNLTEGLPNGGAERRLTIEELNNLAPLRDCSSGECSICYNPMNYERNLEDVEDEEPTERVRRLPCSHYFHSVCIETWFQRDLRCPNCRTNVRSVSLNNNQN